MGIILVGTVAAYLLDALRVREGALGAVWLTMGAVNLSTIISVLAFSPTIPALLSLCVAFVSAITLFLTGVWATLQFKWVQVQYPVVVLAFEKLVLGCCLPVAAVLDTYGLVSAVGATAAPFYLAPVLCVLYYLCALPLPSSFHAIKPSVATGGKGTGTQVQGALEGCIAAVLTVGMPALLYLASHISMLGHWVHFWSLLLLGSGPLLFLTVLPSGLWWLPGSERSQQAWRSILLLLALASTLAGLEGRVIFRAFGQYIPLHPPWSYLAVTAALAIAAAVFVVHQAGMLGDELGRTTTGAALVCSATAGGLAAGLPLHIMPAPMLAATGLAMFYEGRELRYYCMFVVGALATGAWFLHHHFWALNVQLEGMQLRALCRLIFAAMVPATVLPGLILARSSQGFTNAFLVTQALLLTFLEEHLYAGEVEEGWVEAYPAYLVVLTSGLGVLLASRLAEAKTVGRTTTWLLQCMFAAKLAMLLLPEARLANPVLAYVLAASPPLLLASNRPQQRRMAPWQGAAHAVSIAAAVTYARFAVFDLLQWQIGSRPAEGLVLGVLLLLVAAGCQPLIFRHFGHSFVAKRLVAVTAAAGVLLVLLRPPMPVKGGTLCPNLPFGLCPRIWDEGHVPEHEVDDVSMYGAGVLQREHWPLWMLVAAVLSGLMALTSGGRVSSSSGLKLAFAALSGTCVGLYMALEFFPRQGVLQVLVLAATLLVAASLPLLRNPSAAAALLPGMLALWGGSFPVAYFVQAASGLPALPASAQELFPDAGVQLEDERWAANRAALLAVYSAEALLLAFALKLKVSAAIAGKARPALHSARPFRGGGNAAQWDRAAGFLGSCMPQMQPLRGGGKPPQSSGFKGAVGLAMENLAGQGLGWLPTAGNLITGACYLGCLALSSKLDQSLDAAIVVLAPILLLLSQDPLILPGLGSQQRYAPPVAATSLGLFGWSGMQLVETTFMQPESLLKSTISVRMTFLSNALLIAGTIPNHVLFVQYLWSRQRVADVWLVATTPCCLPALFLADYTTPKLLAGFAMVAAAVQYAAMRHIRQQGMKVI